MEHKYIDADALLDKLNEQFRDMDNNLYDSQDDALEDAEVCIRQMIHNMPAADVKPNDVWIERANKALMEIKGIRLCDILHDHGACSGCGDDDWVCIALKIEALVANIVGGSEE